MKLVCRVYLLSALWLIFHPSPCTGSPPAEAFFPMSPPDQADQTGMVMESGKRTNEAESLASFHPVEPSFSTNQGDEPDRITDENTPSNPSEPEEPVGTIADPLEPVNRAFFHFNDKLYFWVLRPVAAVYMITIPEDGRIGVRNFFSNLMTPVRLVNCLFQAHPKCAGTETLRFVLNTTIGVAGFFDLAQKTFNLEKQDKDFGQTLGIWGMGPVFYLDLPILGPSNLRDGLGYVVDVFFDPLTYIFIRPIFYVVRPVGVVKGASPMLGEYEGLKKAALDPYIVLREAYYQYRQNKIKHTE